MKLPNYVVLIAGTPSTKPRLKLVLRLKTIEQVMGEFACKGLSVRGWAIANGFSPTLVHEILSDRNQRPCLRGQSHKIAVSLGLKTGEIVNSIHNAI